MNKFQLAERIADKVGISKKAAEQAVEVFLGTVIKAMKNGDKVSLTGFGTFEARVRHARTGVNPQNPSEKIQMPEILVPKFKAGKTLKDTLKNRGE
ncbi:HU family DNA-binding protein [Patescibacteria group bacterium]|nr:HU family DNA-binding protein [Patescibacteria group bacterium]MBU4512315.1 HU family DNA-binding protein [Patescibacteria group bacterium]MCG2693320.1 HU family DNA-binding protein [Candidatus Parcubacteria bacterium]